jgi:acyl dehydratase
MTHKIKTLDEFEVAYKDGLGVPLQPRRWRTVTEDWLERVGDGLGDYNPMWRHRDYADAGRHHSLIASPASIFSVNFGANASIWGNIPEEDVATKDLTMLYIGADIEWFRPMWLGDRIRSVETPVSIRRKEMRQIGSGVVCTGVTEYYNHRGELVAKLSNHMLRFENKHEAVESSNTEDLADKPRVAPDPLVWNRIRRGNMPRLWEDVAEGAEIEQLDKGTYTNTELYLFTHAALSTHRSRMVDEGTIDMGAGGRADPEYAKNNRAQATSFDYGPQRICWLIQAVTDWMGDEGDLLSISTQLRRPNLVGDTNRVVGSVIRRFTDGPDDHRVEIEVRNLNQDDVVTASGTAVVRLPNTDRVHNTNLDVLFSPEHEFAPSIYG